MGTKLFLAITAILVALAVLPLFNEVLAELIETHLIAEQGWLGDDYRTAFWRLFPIIIGGYIFIILPLQILARGAFRKRGDGDDFDRPE